MVQAQAQVQALDLVMVHQALEVAVAQAMAQELALAMALAAEVALNTNPPLAMDTMAALALVPALGWPQREARSAKPLRVLSMMPLAVKLTTEPLARRSRTSSHQAAALASTQMLEERVTEQTEQRDCDDMQLNQMHGGPKACTTQADASGGFDKVFRCN